MYRIKVKKKLIKHIAIDFQIFIQPTSDLLNKSCRKIFIIENLQGSIELWVDG